MQMKDIKKGDKLVVRSDLKLEHSYGADLVNDEMMKRRGEVVTVASIRRSNKKFSIKEDHWSWTPQMMKCKVEDTVEEYEPDPDSTNIFTID